MALSNPLEYWNDRYSKQGALTVGTSSTIELQDNEYKIKEDFIFSHCPTNLKVLDYGCGIGRYAHKFKDYVGVDISSEAIKIAKKLNPNKKFYNGIKKRYGINMFFTATVLQHCNDKIVNDIFYSLSLYKKDITIVLYENDTDGESYHVKGRTPNDYKNIIEKFFKVKKFEYFSHIVHNEKHSLTIIKTCE